MAHPWVAGGGDSLQIRKATVNILSKQSWTANKGCSSSLGGWVRVNINVKNQFVSSATQGLRFGLILWNLGNGK
jgi:hypothetical protein